MSSSSEEHHQDRTQDEEIGVGVTESETAAFG